MSEQQYPLAYRVKSRFDHALVRDDRAAFDEAGIVSDVAQLEADLRAEKERADAAEAALRQVHRLVNAGYSFGPWKLIKQLRHIVNDALSTPEETDGNAT